MRSLTQSFAVKMRMTRWHGWAIALSCTSLSASCGGVDESPGQVSDNGGSPNGGSPNGGSSNAGNTAHGGTSNGGNHTGGSNGGNDNAGTGNGGVGGETSSGGVAGNSAGGEATNGGTSGAGGTTAEGGSGGAEGGSGGAAGNGGVPNSQEGIAANHPGDQGIASDPAVIFADDFESYTQASQLNDNWDAVYQNQYVTITQEAAHVFAGDQALEFTLPQQAAELSDATDKVLSEEQDKLYLRYYSKFLPPYDVVGSSHNGSSISAHYFINGQATPGVPANGTNKFLVNLENWRGEAETPSPGYLNVYVYHPEQRSQWGDHFFPTGLVMPNTSILEDFGADFVARDDIITELDRWYCYEYMVQANTPGSRDGRISVWLDGVLVADFKNLRFRDTPSLKIDRFGLSFHIGSNPNGVAKKWYDNVVAAKSYIGPMAPQ